MIDRVTWSLGAAETVNDFEPAQINAADSTVNEPTTTTPVTGQLPVTLSGPDSFLSLEALGAGRHGQPVTIHYATIDSGADAGTATVGVDYISSSGDLTFDPTVPVTTLSVPVTIRPDATPDNGETVLVNLSAAVNGVLVRATGELTIIEVTPPTTATQVVRPGHWTAGRWISP